MQKSGLRKIAASMGADTRFIGTGGMRAVVGARVGQRVPWGSHFQMGVDVREAMKLSTALGTHKIDFCPEGLQESKQWKSMVDLAGS
ncbi:g7713 [Coccomyxa elongata]